MQPGQVHGQGEGHVEVHSVQEGTAEVGVLGVAGTQAVEAEPRHCPMQRVREIASRRCDFRGAKIDGLICRARVSDCFQSIRAQGGRGGTRVEDALA